MMHEDYLMRQVAQLGQMLAPVRDEYGRLEHAAGRVHAAEAFHAHAQAIRTRAPSPGPESHTP
jgi:hypothetical protein